MSDTHSASAVLMVRPTSFGFDDQTARSNAFQHQPTETRDQIVRHADSEFQNAVDVLTKHGIRVIVFEDSATPTKPNAVFPNNWLSTWGDGRIYLYPMATKSRRIERSQAVLDALQKQFDVTEIIDISESETRGNYLESTGVMVFDHRHKIVYGCVSIRCDEKLFSDHAKVLGYTPVLFHAYDAQGTPIYHTNVLMGVQDTTAVVCLEAVTDQAERNRLVESLEATGHEIVNISYEQMGKFCGNVLELQNHRGEHILALSQTAYDNLTPEQRTALSRDKTLLPLAIPTIETIGGGSVRCMLAELFLQPHVAPTTAQSIQPSATITLDEQPR